MVTLDLLIYCDSPQGRRIPHVRAWVDLEPELGLDAEYELGLEQVDDHALRARLQFEQTASYFLYRVGLAADPGTVWRMLILDTMSGTVLHEDCDLLATPKSYVLGSCDLARPTALRRPHVLQAVS